MRARSNQSVPLWRAYGGAQEGAVRLTPNSPPARRSTDMLDRPTSRRWALVAAAAALAGVAGATRLATGSDHQDTPDVELNQASDMTDLYVFPGSSPDRIVLVM